MLAECSEERGRVLRDVGNASSFMQRTEGAQLVARGLATLKENPRPTLQRSGSSAKRTRLSPLAGGSETTVESTFPDGRRGPGMWAGIL